MTLRYGRLHRQLMAIAVLLLCAVPARAAFHLWQITEVFSDASGAVQYVELSTTVNGETFLAGHSLTAAQGSSTRTFDITRDVSGNTANHKLLIATQGFANLGVVTPDYVMPNGFLFMPGGSVNWAGVDGMTYTALPTDGVHSIDRQGNVVVNSPTNFAGQTGSVSVAAAAPSTLENPQPGSFQSGIGLISGWSCQGPSIGIEIDGIATVAASYGSDRLDTAGVCGASNTKTGFGLLFNFNLIGTGTHTARLFVNGQAQGSPVSFTVTRPAGEFLTGVSKEVTVPDFPSPGRTAVLIWQQAQQNFMLKSVTP